MSGLMEKDIRLMFSRKSTFFIIIILAITLGMSTDGSFILGYLVCMGCLNASSTISYDEFDNGYPFLMTLPITRDTYVCEKYLFSIFSGIVAWLLGSVIYMIKLLTMNTSYVLAEELTVLFAFLPIVFILVAIIIPFPLKYGSEKGRMAMMITFGILIAVGVLGTKLFEDFQAKFASVITFFSSLPTVGIIIAVTIFTLLIILLSFQISRNIMRRKEF